MDAPAELAQLCKRYLFNERLLAATTQGFSPEDWALPPGPHGGNCAHWLLAHVVATRRSLLRILGDESAVEDWEAAYAQGGVSTLHAATPAPSALHAEFARQGLLLAQRLGSLSVDQAAAAFPRPLPDGGTTLADAAHFLFFHETYHLGQIGLLRRICGKPGFM